MNRHYIGEYCSIPIAVIGKYCSIGQRCSIGGWNHDYNRLSTSPRIYREILRQDYIDQKLQVIIGNDVWIGDNVVIIKEKIGDGTVIGAGSVISRDIPPYFITAGNSATVIKYKFDKNPSAITRKWWNKELQVFENISN